MMSVERFKHYTLGNSVIDEQHRGLFKAVDHFVTEMKDNQTGLSKAHGEIILSLWENHVTTEKKIIDECDFPYAEYHLEAHARIKIILRDMVTRNRPYSSNELIAFEEAFLEHVDHFDRQLIEYHMSWLN